MLTWPVRRSGNCATQWFLGGLGVSHAQAGLA
jgi:hypothetical protein